MRPAHGCGRSERRAPPPPPGALLPGRGLTPGKDPAPAPSRRSKADSGSLSSAHPALAQWSWGWSLPPGARRSALTTERHRQPWQVAHDDHSPGQPSRARAVLALSRKSWTQVLGAGEVLARAAGQGAHGDTSGTHGPERPGSHAPCRAANLSSSAVIPLAPDLILGEKKFFHVNTKLGARNNVDICICDQRSPSPHHDG